MSVKADKGDKLPLDAKLLSDAVIELNISRRSVGLYPPDHPIVGESLERAFSYLQKLFELRPEITLGVAKDALLVDEYQLDRRNPVFKEFSLSLHSKGLAAVTFHSGITKEELLAFHSLLTMADSPVGKALVESAKGYNMPHMRLTAIDFSLFGFAESEHKTGEATGEIWHDYVYSLLHGKLPEEAIDAVLTIPPDQMASVMNNAVSEDTNADAYDRVITAYLQRKNRPRLSSEAFTKFLSFMEKLKPEVRNQFLSRTSCHITENIENIEMTLADMTPERFEQIAGLISRQSSLVPETLQNLIGKLSQIKDGKDFQAYILQMKASPIHDIEIDENILKLFAQDNFNSFVREDYRRELTAMIEAAPKVTNTPGIITEHCSNSEIDKALLSILLELIETDFITDEDYLVLLTKLSESVNAFLGTGRFEEILEIYNALSSHILTSRFSDKASSMVEYFFRSENFISSFVYALSTWGRKDREGAYRLSRALKLYIIPSLLDELEKEKNSGMRKFLLSVLVSIGSEAIPYAVKRLHDDRWYIVRNMLYLMRECNATRQVEQIKKFIKHKKTSIRIEALSALLHFKTPDAVPYLKLYLNSKKPELVKKSVRLAGKYNIREVVPLLIGMLEKKDLMGNESLYKIDIVIALGDIGDDRAVPALMKTYNTKTLFYRGHLDDLKLEIFKTLDRYSPAAVMPLVRAGLSSEHEEIRRICESFSQGPQGLDTEGMQ